MWGSKRRPTVREQIQDDPIFFVDRLHEEYTACEKGYKEEKRDMLQKCAVLAASFQENGNFERIAVHPYWDRSRQKPKRNGRAKWAVYLMVRPKTPASRKLAGKYGQVIDALFDEGIAPDAVADAIKQRHGIPGVLKQRKQARKARANLDSNEYFDQDGGIEKGDSQSRGGTQTTDGEGESVETARVPALRGISPDGGSENQTSTFSKKRDDTLFVTVTPEQMRIVLREGVVYIQVEVSPISGTEEWVITVT